MTREDLYEASRRAPFEPFRVIISTGMIYAVNHPNLIMVGARSVIIGIPDLESGPELFSRTVKIDLAHVVAVEDIPTTTTR